jgi:tripartite ATP-independent transporter DctP family solute receptor
MVISRRALIASSAAVTTTATVNIRTRPANAAQFVYRYGNDCAPDHPLSTWAQKAADRIKIETDGRLEIKCFPNSQLGGDPDMLAQLRSGALEFLAYSGSMLSVFVPVSAIDGVGFAFKDPSTVWKAVDGDLGAYVRNATNKTNVMAMERIWDNGFRNITSSKGPIEKPADLKGLKIRVPVTPLWAAMFKAFGANPISLSFSEVYSALQTKVADAHDNTLAIILFSKIYEVQKYLTISRHIWCGYWLLANKRAFGRLPPDVQDIVSRIMNECAMGEREELAKFEDEYRKELGERGMIINQVEAAPFRNYLSEVGFYKEWHKTYGDEAWSLLERYTGKLA